MQLSLAEFLLILSLAIILYTYAGYGMLLYILTRVLRPRRAAGHEPAIASALPEVTLVIAAYNEERIIAEKLRNCLSLDYPAEKLKILVITDGSTDDTNAIVQQFPAVRLLFSVERKGKLAAMNRAIDHVHTPITVFTDANTFLNPESIRMLVDHYKDAEVGAVTGEKKIMQEEQDLARGEGLYWKYESLLKKLDSDLNTVVGAAGELFSVRTELYTKLSDNIIIEDFVQSLLLCMSGYRVVYEPRAFAAEKGSLSLADELERKIRITAGGFQAMVYLKGLLNIFRYGTLSFQYISHRVLRWTLCPLALPVLLFSSVAAFNETGYGYYGVFTLLQLLFYLMALVGWIGVRKGVSSGLFYIPFYFTFMNMSVFAGFYRFLAGKQDAVWQKAGR